VVAHPVLFGRASKSRRMRWAGHVIHTGERRGIYRILVGKPEGKRPLGRSRRRRDERTWTGSMWLRIETGCGHL